MVVSSSKCWCACVCSSTVVSLSFTSSDSTVIMVTTRSLDGMVDNKDDMIDAGLYFSVLYSGMCMISDCLVP